LSPIALDEIEERARFLLLLERSKAYCKINRFQDALADAAVVSDHFRHKNPIYFMKAEAVTNTVLRDQERWDEAVAQGHKMVALAESEGGRRTKVVAYHALARSLALAGQPDMALDYAAKTLGEAVTADERGEAFFAEGEGHRHKGDIDKAISAYVRSENTTFISGKTDLYIWCKLCLADCYFMLENLNEADRQLNHFSSAIRTRYDDHPLETLHWKLSDAANQWRSTRNGPEAIAMFDVARQYDDILRIKWPAEYCVALQANRIVPKKL
jgi:tetratricopeptide (TPR) repeat protein